MDKTTQGLKTLAEYMGEDYNNINESWKALAGYKYPPYNTSWDALVPVYAKAVEYAEIVLGLPSNSTDIMCKYYKAHDNNNIQAAFEAVVELVTLINKENGK